MSLFPSMAPKYYRNHVNKNHPFMTCIVKVDTQSHWQKTVKSVLRRCHGVHSFRMDDNGVVEISGTVDPNLLLGILGKTGRSAQVSWLQFGECSSNLFMQTSQAHSRDGRYLHAADLSRPKLPSHQAIDNENYGYGYGNPYYHSYGNNQNYYHLPCGYNSQGDSQQNYDNEYEYGYGHGGSQVQSRSVTQARSGEDMSCCTVM